MNEPIVDYVIIGGGAAGLATAALLEKKQLSYRLFEQHHFFGGQSSYFTHQGYTFDVGATTLSGFQDENYQNQHFHGPLARFCRTINLEIDKKQMHPGLITHFNNMEWRHSFNHEVIRENLKQMMQGHGINCSHDREVKIQKAIIHFLSIQKMLSTRSYFSVDQYLLPIHHFSPFLNNSLSAWKKNLALLELFPLLFKSYRAYSDAAFVDFNSDEEIIIKEMLLTIFRELLLITAQNSPEQTPALMGILGVTYPDNTYYPMGGMKGFVKSLEKKCSHLYAREQVLKLSFIHRGKFKGYNVTTNKRSIFARNIISTLPENNNRELLSLKLRDDSALYSAFTLYFTIPNTKRQDLYHQVITKRALINDAQSYFVSFSHPEDFQRSPAIETKQGQKQQYTERQTVTISIHIPCDEFPFEIHEQNKEAYESKKAALADIILNDFTQVFDLSRSDIGHLKTGTNKTFRDYTLRHLGSVGGLGHDLKTSLLEKVYHPKIAPHFYQIGDQHFPGQGVASVIKGAMNLVDQLIDPH